MELIQKAVQSRRQRETIAWHGGVNKYSLREVVQACQLYCKNNDQPILVGSKKLQSFEDLVAFAERDTNDEVHWKSVVEYIKIMVKTATAGVGVDNPWDRSERSKEGICALQEELEAMLRCEATRPDVLFTTTHQAKGFEWDVTLADDFQDLPWVPLMGKGSHTHAGIEQEEVNCLYVAVTHAKKTLFLNADLRKFLLTRDLWDSTAVCSLASRPPARYDSVVCTTCATCQEYCEHNDEQRKIVHNSFERYKIELY
ncbi:unnamed protein product [Discosporangium mesarthrocarpum]